MLIKDVIAAAVKKFARNEDIARRLSDALVKLNEDYHYGGPLNTTATADDAASFEFRVENLVSCPFNTLEFMVKLICQDLNDVRYHLQQCTR